jgi:hypothetical protein
MSRVSAFKDTQGVECSTLHTVQLWFSGSGLGTSKKMSDE